MVRADPITRELQAIHQRFASTTVGEVAAYIPELSRANPAHFGVALMGLEGRVYAAGDSEIPFTIQSVSKPFVYAMALEALGLDEVTDCVGVEPSGEGFNAISLDPETGRPANPMINAGAIVVTSLIGPSERFERIRDGMSRFAGRNLSVDEDVYRSELETGDRNRALAYLTRSAGALRGDVDETLDAYFRQCAIRVTATDIAAMAATLANRGVHPVTGDVVVSEATAGYVLTVMATCGMYDYSGNWLLRVGLPAKSGVSGALVAASPDQFGMGLFSPPLDRKGNSLRGVAACKELATRFDMGWMRHTGRPTASMYASDLSEISTGWAGRDAALPDDVVVRAMQGDIGFADAERLLSSFVDLNRVHGKAGQRRRVVLDLHRVRTVSKAAEVLMRSLVRDLEAAGHEVGVVDVSGRTLVDERGVVSTVHAALRRMG